MAVEGVRPTPRVIESSRRGIAPIVREAWNSRDVAFFLAWRDARVRYKQSLIGAAWAILQPVAFAAVFGLVFGRIARIPTEAGPYWLVALVALAPWTCFAQTLSASTMSLVGNAHLIHKVYIPRLLFPVASAGLAVVDSTIASVVVLAIAIAVGHAAMTAPVLLLMPILASVVALALGIGLSAVNARYRDVSAAVPLLTQLLFFGSPVAYEASLVPDDWQWAYGLNPMAGVIEVARWAVFGDGAVGLLVPGALTTAVLLGMSARRFSSSEAALTDLL